MQSTKSIVPRDTADPIQFLLEGGWSMPQLAAAWGYRTVDSIYRLKRFDNIPPHARAELMASTFGWSSAGDVIDFWAANVRARKEAVAA